MRKLYLVVISCVALVAFMGFSASAQAEPLIEPGCAGAGNPIEILDFSIVTSSNQAYEVSDLLGQAYACGSYAGGQNTGDPPFFGAETFVNHATIVVPPGFEVADSDLVTEGSYAGIAIPKFLLHTEEGYAGYVGGAPVVITTDDKDECRREIAEEIVGKVPPSGDMITCLRGEVPGGTGGNWSWFVRDPETGQQSFTIGPMHTPDPRIDPGLTYFELGLCDYFGEVGGDECGDSGQWQQKNGSGCSLTKGFGDFTATTTREDKQVTPEALSHVAWVPDACFMYADY